MGYKLVMPFLPVESRGGPYEDEAYTAGFQMGRIDRFLEVRRLAKVEQLIYRENLPQADLMAMRHGYRLEVAEYEENPDWVFICFFRVVAQEL